MRYSFCPGQATFLEEYNVYIFFLFSIMNSLIDEIDVLYNILVQKEASIFQLRKIIIDHL